MNLVEKILAKASGRSKVEPGEIVIAKVDRLLLHDFGAYLISNVFEDESKNKVIKYPDNIVVVYDHHFCPANEAAAELIKHNNEFCKKYGIKNVYQGGEGICHYVLSEQGYVKPGMVIVGSDSHTTVFGGFGCFSAGCGNQSIASMIMPYGKAWFRVPGTVKINIEGKAPEDVLPRDVINYALREVGEKACIYKAVEWSGSYIENLSVEERYVFPLMSVEMGAKTGYIEPDEKMIKYLKQFNDEPFEEVYSDPDYKYERVYNIDVTNMEPSITFPPSFVNVKTVSEAAGIKINQAVVGSCPNAHIDDFRMAAKMLDGKKVHPGVQLLFVPGTRAIYNQMIDEGIMSTLAKAGANIFPASCGACQTVNMAAQAAGDVMISTQPRNFPGRTGSPLAKTYLGSPLTVVASAIKGEIVHPRVYM